MQFRSIRPADGGTVKIVELAIEKVDLYWLFHNDAHS